MLIFIRGVSGLLMAVAWLFEVVVGFVGGGAAFFVFLGLSGVSMMEMWRCCCCCCCCLVFVWTPAWHCCVDFFIGGGSRLSMVVARRFEVVVGFCRRRRGVICMNSYSGVSMGVARRCYFWIII